MEDARAALFHARASVVASGTATVEAALIGNPFVVVYRVSPVTYAIAKRVVAVPHVAMANLIAGKRVVPELIQDDFTAANIVQQIEPLLPDGLPRQSMMKELARIHGLLSSRPAGQGGEHGGAIDRVAAITLDRLGALSLAPANTYRAILKEQNAGPARQEGGRACREPGAFRSSGRRRRCSGCLARTGARP